ncbi:hypothetical protein SAMN02745163_03574 [Clostridium cavendishii DSM 21758]|uniref:Uncharacterized protein n=1 Tax=Clostridium cavendishii DSM 21758 TaxID=1121302 RepID=A0A1M6R8U0_9CLOT|nr:hypothetical protein [Clostridium cavendishii]SHK28883.1 hypothetical protein SAMN02745163_03574 [Clostridium cavendishii DSM 21758]
MSFQGQLQNKIVNIVIKPHHFLDIIKLYGKGIEQFIPNIEYGHNFYGIANLIIRNKNIIIELTIDKDDICGPCKYIGKNGLCTDKITHINKITSKDEWNKILDTRILSGLNLEQGNKFTAYDFCKLLYLNSEKIFEVWKEETKEAKDKRYEAFCIGAKRYLDVL